MKASQIKISWCDQHRRVYKTNPIQNEIRLQNPKLDRNLPRLLIFYVRNLERFDFPDLDYDYS